MKSPSSSLATSKIVTTFGLRSEASVSASRRSSASMLLSCAASVAEMRRFTATQRFNWLS